MIVELKMNVIYWMTVSRTKNRKTTF